MKKRFSAEHCRGRWYLVDLRRGASVEELGVCGEQAAKAVADHLNSAPVQWSASAWNRGRVRVSGFFDGGFTHHIGSFGDSLDLMVEKVEREIIRRTITDLEVPAALNWIATDVCCGVEISCGDSFNFRVVGKDQFRRLGQALLNRAAAMGGEG